nr:MAG TPA: hypothetical protein [Caudoviricetes sp.]
MTSLLATPSSLNFTIVFPYSCRLIFYCNNIITYIFTQRNTYFDFLIIIFLSSLS